MGNFIFCLSSFTDTLLTETCGMVCSVVRCACIKRCSVRACRQGPSSGRKQYWSMSSPETLMAGCMFSFFFFFSCSRFFWPSDFSGLS